MWGVDELWKLYVILHKKKYLDRKQTESLKVWLNKIIVYQIRGYSEKHKPKPPLYSNLFKCEASFQNARFLAPFPEICSHNLNMFTPSTDKSMRPYFTE